MLLLPGVEDRDIWHYFATASMPDRDRAERVLSALSASAAPLSTPSLEAMVDIRRTPLELLLKVLDVDGAVARVQGGWIATGRPWTYDEDRYGRIAAERIAEQQHMIEYEQTRACRMEFLQRSLDDDTATPCGRCDNCAGAWFPTAIGKDATDAASAALDRVGVPIEPRRQWPTGADRLGVPVRGRIPADEQSEEGRALARLTDLGWGGTLREMFAAGAADAPVPPNVLAACVRVLAEWGWTERPVAVVAMPSRSKPQLVGTLARGIADIGRMPMLGALDLVDGGPTGGPGGNSAFRLAGVWGRFTAAGLGCSERSRAAGRRPRRQQVDDDGGRARAASSRCDRGAPVRSRPARLSPVARAGPFAVPDERSWRPARGRTPNFCRPPTSRWPNRCVLRRRDRSGPPRRRDAAGGLADSGR